MKADESQKMDVSIFLEKDQDILDNIIDECNNDYAV
jgi:hypothetical protein